MASPMTMLKKAMTSMKKAPESEQEISKPCLDSPAYPWGLEIRLEKDSLKKLGLSGKNFEIDQAVEVTAKCKVMAIRSSAGRYNDSETVELQITDMAVDCGKEKKP